MPIASNPRLGKSYQPLSLAEPRTLNPKPEIKTFPPFSPRPVLPAMPRHGRSNRRLVVAGSLKTNEFSVLVLPGVDKPRWLRVCGLGVEVR